MAFFLVAWAPQPQQNDLPSMSSIAYIINPYELERCVDELLYEAEFYVSHTSSIFANFSDSERRKYLTLKHKFCVLLLAR